MPGFASVEAADEEFTVEEELVALVRRDVEDRRPVSTPRKVEHES